MKDEDDGGGVLGQAVFWTQHGYLNHKFTTAVVICNRLAHNQDKKISHPSSRH